jgi:hypothetical protein
MIKKPIVLIPLLIIINACLWGFTMIMISHTLKGTGAYQEIQNILAAGAGASNVILGGGLVGLIKASKARELDQNSA